MHRTLTRTILPVLLLFALLAPAIAPVTAQEDGAVSRPGEYSGYSEPIYDEWVRISQYVTVPDGTKLAVDMYRPSVDGVPVSEPLPVVWSADRYHRADVQDGQVITKLDNYPYLETLVKHGYVVAAVDMRGTGASYGTRQGPFTQPEIDDLYYMTEWFAAQPWCDGNIGMYGGSYVGTAQYWAATTAPPHLKAIFPEVGPFEGYAQAYPGGVFNDKMLWGWQMGNIFLDVLIPAAPVDEDTDGSMLAEAIEEHKGNLDVYLYAKSLPYRDSESTLPERPGAQTFLEDYLSEVRNSGIPMYHWGGWYDMFAREPLLWFRNVDNPQKIVIGPWFHSERDDDNDFMATEHLRWYDYWLKGIDNGIMDEPPIYYYTIGAPKGEKWQFAWEWPLPSEQATNYYFRSGPSGSVSSVNDGLLRRTQPTDATGKDDYTVDYTTTTGSPDPLKVRWTEMLGAAVYGAPLASDMTPLDEKGLTYTTPPLASDVEVTGHPIVHLWVSSTATDGDFFIYLEEIDGDGVSQFVSDRILRASHRATATPPWDHMGLPWHRSYEEDVIDLPAEPVELVFDLFPTSNIFDKGHRIRVTITCADSDNFETPELSPPPTVSVYRNTEYASYITLPTHPTPTGEGAGCFIATAAYGSYLDSHVESLREFRDQYLVTNPVGSALVSAYYEVSPPVAEFIDDNPALKPIVRVGLLPAVAMSTVAVSTTSVEKMAIVCSLLLISALMVVWLRRKGVLNRF